MGSLGSLTVSSKRILIITVSEMALPCGNFVLKPLCICCLLDVGQDGGQSGV